MNFSGKDVIAGAGIGIVTVLGLYEIYNKYLERKINRNEKQIETLNREIARDDYLLTLGKKVDIQGDMLITMTKIIKELCNDSYGDDENDEQIEDEEDKE